MSQLVKEAFLDYSNVIKWEDKFWHFLTGLDLVYATDFIISEGCKKCQCVFAEKLCEYICRQPSDSSVCVSYHWPSGGLLTSCCVCAFLYFGVSDLWLGL